MNALVIAFDFILWWYTKGLIKTTKNLYAIARYLTIAFSVKESVLGLFSPWKRLVGPRRPGLDGLRDWILDNIISRGVGFFMRAMLLFLFLISFLFYVLFFSVTLSLWLFWPIILIVIFFWGT